MANQCPSSHHRSGLLPPLRPKSPDTLPQTQVVAGPVASWKGLRIRTCSIPMVSLYGIFTPLIYHTKPTSHVGKYTKSIQIHRSGIGFKQTWLKSLLSSSSDISTYNNIDSIQFSTTPWSSKILQSSLAGCWTQKRPFA